MASWVVWDAFERRDHKEAVRLLGLQDPEVLYQVEPDLLFYSTRNGWLDVTRNLITNYRFDPHQYYKDKYYHFNGESCLYTAAKGNHVDIVEYLIKECGCDPMMKATTEYGSGPFLYYVASAGLLDILKCMVMNINGHIMDEQYRTTSGRTVLHCAVRHINVVKYLINQCNCDIMTPGKYGNIILYDSAYQGSLDVMKYLINTHHCNPMATNNYGETLLHLAVRHIDVVKYLINQCNCDMMVTDRFGWTPLHVAARRGRPKVVEFLLLTGNCDPLAKDIVGRTPLQLAKGRRYDSDILSLLSLRSLVTLKYLIQLILMLTFSLWVILELVKVLLVMSSMTQLLALLFLVPLEMLEG